MGLSIREIVFMGLPSLNSGDLFQADAGYFLQSTSDDSFELFPVQTLNVPAPSYQTPAVARHQSFQRTVLLVLFEGQ